MSFNVPVVFIVFNRPNTTSEVFEAIRKIRPSKLLVIADGPRPEKEGEVEKCYAARAILKRVDWPCEVLTNYSDFNLGCRDRVASGLNWVFSLVEEAIILEDDCLPDPSFFTYCQELLQYYRDDKRIMVISGDNFLEGKRRTDYSYYFSRFNHCWGWATWRRAWKYYDLEMKQWPLILKEGWLKDILQNEKSIRYWEKFVQDVYDKKINTWDVQWTFACWLQSGLSILPNVNLVSNIGFDGFATHTKDRENKLAFMPVESIEFPLKHSPFVLRDNQADMFTQKHVFTPNKLARLKKMIAGILNLRKGG